MAVSWTLRPATRHDVGPIWRIEVARFPEPWTRRMLLEEITTAPNRRYRVAEERRRVIGYLGAMYVGEAVHINTIAVRTADEGRGIAADLLRDALADARDRGVDKATLEVAVSNDRAQALYRHFGFAPVGVRKSYYERTGEDALVLWADLSSPVG